MPSREYAIELAGISKYFGEVAANDSIDLAVKRGEILALLGENGSGKTTLMNMLSGIYMPDAGSIYLNGEKIVIHSPEDAKRFGIGMIHQQMCIRDSSSITIFAPGRRSHSSYAANCPAVPPPMIAIS